MCGIVLCMTRPAYFPGITIVIPVTEVTLRYVCALDTCLLSLARQTLSRDLFDVIISFVWDTPQDMAPLVDLCMEYDVLLAPYRHSLPGYPPSLSRNVGGRWGRREVMTFVDADAVIHPRALEVALEEFDDEEKVCVLIRTRMTPFSTGHDHYKVMGTEAFNNVAINGPLAPGTGCCTFVRQADFEALGGLDERFVGYGATDIDFTERLKLDGFTFVDLTEMDGIVNMHQAHPRDMQDMDYRQVESRKRTHDLMVASLEAKEIIRNANGWGGMGHGEED